VVGTVVEAVLERVLEGVVVRGTHGISSSSG
jgi:hypothetical protein